MIRVTSSYGTINTSDEINTVNTTNEGDPLISSHNEDTPQFTIDEAIENIGYGILQIRLTVFTSLLWVSDSMEFMLLAILGPMLQCEWHLTSLEVAFISGGVFLGEALGVVPFGILSDRYGRKRILWTSTFFLVYFGVMTAFVPSYYWLLAVRFCVGVCVSVLIHSVTYLSEFLPIRSRSSSILLLEVAWAAGSGLVCLLGILVLQSLGWRYMVALTSVPALIVLFFFPTVPVSPRYLLASNEVSGAQRVLARAARENCRALPPGELVLAKARRHSVSIDMPTEQQPNLKKRGNILELFSSEYRVTTLLLMAIWIVVGFCYYGAVLLSTELFQYDSHCVISDSSNTTTTTEYKCKELTNQDLVYILLISLGEFPGIIISLVLNDTVGRKLSMVCQLILTSLFYGLLSLCTGTNDKILKTVFLFIIRACTGGCIQSLYLYTSEVYPTRIRSSALAFHCLMSRLGSIVASFTATALLEFNFYATIAIFAFGSFGNAILVFLLPYETKGAQLGDNTKRKFLC